jgi:hypothetical protein
MQEIIVFVVFLVDIFSVTSTLSNEQMLLLLLLLLFVGKVGSYLFLLVVLFSGWKHRKKRKNNHPVLYVLLKQDVSCIFFLTLSHTITRSHDHTITLSHTHTKLFLSHSIAYIHTHILFFYEATTQHLLFWRNVNFTVVISVLSLTFRLFLRWHRKKSNVTKIN